MPEEVDVQAESSPATDETPASSPEAVDPIQEAAATNDYATFERLSNARDLGKGEPAKSAERESAKPAPASQPVKPQEPKPQGRPPKPHAASDRIKELLGQLSAERNTNNELRKQIEGRSAENGVTQAPPPAQPAPAPTPPPAPVATAPKDDPEPILEKKPDGSRWKDYDEYRNEWKAWDRREAKREALAEITADQQKAAEARVQAQWKSRWEATAKDPEYPDYAKVAFNKDVHVNQTTVGYLYHSEHGPKILYHLGQNPEVAARLVQLNPYDTVRFLRDFEVQAFQEKPAKPEVPTPTKQTTRMKPPASELSGRNTAPADEMEAAVARGDFRAYERLANQADIRR